MGSAGLRETLVGITNSGVIRRNVETHNKGFNIQITQQSGCIRIWAAATPFAIAQHNDKVSLAWLLRVNRAWCKTRCTIFEVVLGK